MKRYHLLLSVAIVCIATVHSYAQKTEINANAYSGLFSFRGNGSRSTAQISFPDAGLRYYVPFSYGKKSALSYGFELRFLRVTKPGILYGAGVAYEQLKSRATIDTAYADFSGPSAAKGKVILSNGFLTVTPYIGKRFLSNSITIDLLVGVELAFSKRVREVARMEGSKEPYFRFNKTYPVDYRPCVHLNAVYCKIGVIAGYSVGTQNLFQFQFGNPNPSNYKAYTNFLKLGVSYSIKS